MLPAPIRRSLWLLAWVIAGVLGTVVLMRLVWHDGLWLFLLCNIVTPYIYLPAWLIAGCAAFARRWRLFALSLALIIFHFNWVLLPLLPRSPPATAGRTLRVASANLLVVNETPEALAAELERFDADVYFLQELSADWDEAFERLGFWRRYPFNRRINGEDAFGAAIASRLPVRDLEVFWSAELPQLRGVLRLDDRDVELVSIHLLPPRTLDYTRYYHLGADALLDIVRRFGSRSFIVAGDFNSTPDSDFATRMRDVADDAWEAGGRGFGFTWPNGMFQLPPIRLDHVFVSRDLGVLGARVGVGAGSDHRPVVADIARRAAFAR
ncbi:MAG TPA: endonuclease/exonuclease/phosphatase family protein [Polyangia bacterium]|nr:endonuclease/exonuclease/phosphatase family protein [Polyangia bacterium]